MKKIVLMGALVLSLSTLAGCQSKDKKVDTVPEATQEVEATHEVKATEEAKETGELTNEEISSKLSEIRNWLTMDVWNEGFCDISHYIGRGTDSTGGELDLEYTLHKIDNTMEKREEYNEFITGLEDNDTYKELKYIWTEKLYPEMESLYNIIKEKEPVPNDTESTYSADKFSTYHSDFDDEYDKVKEALKEED